MFIKNLISTITLAILFLSIHQGAAAERGEDRPLLSNKSYSAAPVSMESLPLDLAPELQKQNLIKWSQEPLSSAKDHLNALYDPNTLTYTQLLDTLAKMTQTNNDDEKMIDYLDRYLAKHLNDDLNQSLLQAKARADTAIRLLKEMKDITTTIKDNIKETQDFIMQEGVDQNKMVNYDRFDTPYLTYHYDIDDPSTTNTLNKIMYVTCCLDQLCCCLVDNLLCLQPCCHPMSVAIRGNVNKGINSLIDNTFKKIDKKMEIYHFLTNKSLKIKDYDQFKENHLQHSIFNNYNSDDSCCWFFINSGF